MTRSDSTPLVAAFTGEHYTDLDQLTSRIAPPYDVITREQREQYAQRDPHNIVELILPRGDGDKYQRARETLEQWRRNRVLTVDALPSLYVVQQSFKTPRGDTLTRTGVIGAIAVEPFGKGRVKPHERTHAGPKADRLALMQNTVAMFEALLLLARDVDGALKDALRAVVSTTPVAEAELDGQEIRCWRLDGEPAQSLAAIAGADVLYMADGHHRYETALTYLEENPAADRTLGLVVPLGDPGLVVLPSHRIVHGKPVDVERVLTGWRPHFLIHELAPDTSYSDHLAELQSRGTACVIVRPGGNALSLLLKRGSGGADVSFASESAVAALDVAWVDELVVRPLLNAAGEEARLGYSPDAHELIDEVIGGEASAGVLVNATGVEQVLDVADAGAVMPQKATYFMPKVPSGLVSLRFD